MNFSPVPLVSSSHTWRYHPTPLLWNTNNIFFFLFFKHQKAYWTSPEKFTLEIYEKQQCFFDILSNDKIMSFIIFHSLSELDKDF